MTMQVERVRLEQRARQERQMAEDAADPCAYRAHLELARQYERRLLALHAEEAEQPLDTPMRGAGEAA